MLEQQLEQLMPGMGDGLHEHEWREHGGCSGLDDDVYFSRTLELARELDAALAAKLTTLAGRETNAAELREIADLFRPGIGATFTLHCRTLRNSAARRCSTSCASASTTTGPAARPARCSTACA